MMGIVEGNGSGGKLDTRTLRSIVDPPLHVLRSSLQITVYKDVRWYLCTWPMEMQSDIFSSLPPLYFLGYPQALTHMSIC